MMNLELVTLLGKKLDQEVYEVILPTENGEISVFPGHEPLVTLAVPGVITVRYRKEDTEDQLDYFATSGGVIKVNQERIQILVDEADHGDDIVEAEAKAALERAKAMQADASDQVELEKAGQLMDRHAVRLKVAELRRRKKR